MCCSFVLCETESDFRWQWDLDKGELRQKWRVLSVNEAANEGRLEWPSEDCFEDEGAAREEARLRNREAHEQWLYDHVREARES